MATKTYGTVGPERQRAMSGLEFVNGLAGGVLPLNTIAQTLGYDVAEAEGGRVVITLDPTGAHLNPWGTVHGGLTATILDSCMGLAIQSMLEKGIGSTTLEFKISLVRAITPETGPDHGRRQGPQLRPSCRHGGRPGHRRQGPIARARYDDAPRLPKLRCRTRFRRGGIHRSNRRAPTSSAAHSTVFPR